jgi:hypothetical protein
MIKLKLKVVGKWVNNGANEKMSIIYFFNSFRVKGNFSEIHKVKFE